MQTCGSCKYRGEAVEAPNSDWSEWHPTGYFLCDLIKHAGMKSDVSAPAQGAAVVDGSGYFAALCVADDFGCNKWEPAQK